MCPFDSIRLSSQARAAIARVLKNLAAHSHLSILTRSIIPYSLTLVWNPCLFWELSELAFALGTVRLYLWEAHIGNDNKTDVWQGTLVLMVLKTLETIGPLHGYGIARRIEQTSGNLLLLNYGTLYPALLKLEQEGAIASEWGLSDNNRKAKFYKLTRAGRRQLERATRDWAQATTILERFLTAQEDPA